MNKTRPLCLARVEHTQQIKQAHGAVCLDRMEKFTYAPETASSTAGGGSGARAARAASGARAGAGQGGGLRSRGGDASTSGRLDAPRRTGAWVAGSNSKFTTFGNTNTDCTFQGGLPPISLVCRTMDWHCQRWIAAILLCAQLLYKCRAQPFAKYI